MVLQIQPKNTKKHQEVIGTQFGGQDELRGVGRRFGNFRRCSSRIFWPIKKILKTRETRTSNISWILGPTKNVIFACDDYHRIPYRKTTNESFFWMCWFIFYRESYSNFTFSKNISWNSWYVRCSRFASFQYFLDWSKDPTRACPGLSKTPPHAP